MRWAISASGFADSPSLSRSQNRRNVVPRPSGDAVRPPACGGTSTGAWVRWGVVYLKLGNPQGWTLRSLSGQPVAVRAALVAAQSVPPQLGFVATAPATSAAATDGSLAPSLYLSCRPSVVISSPHSLLLLRGSSTPSAFFLEDMARAPCTPQEPFTGASTASQHAH